MSSPAFGTPEWSAAKDFAVLMLLTGGNRYAAQELWLRRVRIHMEAPPDAGESAPKAAQQVAGRRPKPAPARAQAVPKPRTAAQIARHERSQKQLRQKHLARKMWASVRVASRLLAWLIRARACHYFRLETLVDRLEALDEFVERSATLGLRAASRIRGWPRSCGYAIAGPLAALSLTPMHSLRHRLVRSRQYAFRGVAGFLRFGNLEKW